MLEISGAVALRHKAFVENWKFLLTSSRGPVGKRRRFAEAPALWVACDGSAYNFLDYRWCGCGHVRLNFRPGLIFLKYLVMMREIGMQGLFLRAH